MLLCTKHDANVQKITKIVHRPIRRKRGDVEKEVIQEVTEGVLQKAKEQKEQECRVGPLGLVCLVVLSQ